MPPTQQMFHIRVHGNISCNHLVHRNDYGADAQMLVTVISMSMIASGILAEKKTV